MTVLRRAAILTTLAIVSTLVQGAPARAESPLSGLPNLEAFYRAYPKLQETGGGGWNPANRIHWFLETRQAPQGVSAAEVRLAAFAERQARSQARGSGPGWFSVGPTENSGRVNALDFDPTDASVVYAGTGGGVWKSTDGGGSWLPMSESIPVNEIGALRVLPWASQTVLIGTGVGSGATFSFSQGGAGAGPFGIGILKSTDAGTTWNATGLSTSLGGSSGFNAIEANPLTGTILAAANNGVFRSTDDGDTWTQVHTGGNFWDVKWKPGDAARVYVTKGRDPFLNTQTNNGVEVSTDDGLTFSPAGTGQPAGTNLSHIRLGVTPSNPSVIYAHYGEIVTNATLGIYRSTDDGATWAVRNNTLNMSTAQSWYNNILAVDPVDPDVVIAGGVSLHRSTDGGVTFTAIPSGALGTATVPHVDYHALVREPGSLTNYWVGTDGGPWRSTDGGVTWQERRSSLATFQLYDICVSQVDSAYVLAGSQDSGFFERSSGVWNNSRVGDGMMCHIHPTIADRYYAEAQNGALFKTINGGQTWRSITFGITGFPIWVNAFEMDPNRFRTIFTARNNGIWRSLDAGDTWVNVAPHPARWISVSPVDGDVVWTLSNFAGVWRSTDGGDTWAASPSWPAPGMETKIEAHPTDPAAALVTAGGYGTGGPHVLLTTDGGTSWQDVTGDLPDQPANTLLVDPLFPSHWYVGSDTGVWSTTDAGATWFPFGSGLAAAVVTDLELQFATRKLMAGTFGRGVWETTLANPTDVSAPSPAQASLMLDRPFPTPSSDIVRFRWGARGSVSASLTVYDVHGRRILEVDAVAAANGQVRTANWLLDDVSSGVYFAVVESGGRRLARKVVVAR